MKDTKKRKVIVADDNQHSLMYHGLLFERLGYTLIHAKSGLEVLRLLKDVEPNAILLDIGMEIMDGPTLLRHIKEDMQASGIPVIMASGDSSAEIIDQCKKLGCIDYLIKPLTVEKLHAVLEKYNLSAT